MSTAAHKTGTTMIWLANQLTNMFVLTVILLLLVYGCYAIWDSDQVYSAAKSANYESYKPTGLDGVNSFQQLQELNPDVTAWLTVYGTNIDYPIVQGEDNLKYVNTDAKGRYSLSGAIFLDNDSSPDFSDFNSIVYGHHMAKQVMFGEIGLFADESYFEARRYGMLYYGGQEYGLEFFAFVRTDAYDNSIYRTRVPVGVANRQAYLNTLTRKAMHLRQDVPVTADDRIVLLSTCTATMTNGRDILIGRITDTVYSDPFNKNNMDKTREIPAIDFVISRWEQAGPGAKILTASIPVLTMLALVVLAHTRPNRKRAAIKGDK